MDNLKCNPLNMVKQKQAKSPDLYLKLGLEAFTSASEEAQNNGLVELLI